MKLSSCLRTTASGLWGVGVRGLRVVQTGSITHFHSFAAAVILSKASRASRAYVQLERSTQLAPIFVGKARA
jgi:hypothetical protein